MKLNEIRDNRGATQARKRVGARPAGKRGTGQIAFLQAVVLFRFPIMLAESIRPPRRGLIHRQRSLLVAVGALTARQLHEERLAPLL